MSLKDRAYDTIKERILTGVYLPGQMLNEKEIINDLEISRTPFREAINALCKECLVNIYARRGMFVTEITIKDIADIYSVRCELEPFAVRLACNSIPKEILQALKEKMENDNEMNYDQAAREDDDLHRLILKYANNSYLSRMMESIYEHNRRVRVLSTKNHESVLKTIEQHSIILDAMMLGDVAKAEEEMRKHIISSKERAFTNVLSMNVEAFR